ncbi:unnamed protein product [Urochloa humidicola]
MVAAAARGMPIRRFAGTRMERAEHPIYRSHARLLMMIPSCLAADCRGTKVNSQGTTSCGRHTRLAKLPSPTKG